MHADDVFGVPLTEEEARTAVARSSGFPTFAALIEASRYGHTRDNGSLTPSARERACEIMRAGDVCALQRLTEELPELLHPSDQEWRTRSHVLVDALSIEHETRRPELRAIVDWLGTVGFDVQHELNLNLCGRMYRSVDNVQYWFDRGADPHWIAPNGYSVLEHAIWRYWNGDAVDVIAARVHAKPALWIAAGLGDVRTVSTFLDDNGTPTHAVRENRPDFSSMGGPHSIQVPGATDEELLLEVLYVAALNGRANVIEYLASRGAPIDSALFGMPLISVAVGNRWVKVVEGLVRSGANLDVRGSYNGSAREMARELLRSMSDDAGMRRVAALVGVDAASVIAEHAQTVAPAPSFHQYMHDVLALAADDAARQGLAEVSPENLLFGVFRCGGWLLHSYTRSTKLDLDRFRADFAERIRAADDRLDNVALPLRADGQRAIDDAIAMVARRRSDLVTVMDVFRVLTGDPNGYAATLVSQYGGNMDELQRRFSRG